MNTENAFKTEPLAGSFGLAISGVDVSRDLSEVIWKNVVNMLYRHGILVFRGQSLSSDQYIDFGKRWGELVPFFQQRYTLENHPEILLITNEAAPGRRLPPAEAWHADGVYLERPHSATMLYGQEAPDEGGETWFANIVAAYDALSPEEKAEIDDLQVLHMKNAGRRLAIDEEIALTLETQVNEEELKHLKPIKHPLVIQHPVTGAKGIYISTSSAYGIEGMSEDDGVELLIRMKRHVLQPQFRQAYKTMPGEILVWDNYSVIHKAAPTPLSNEDGKRRLLHRITVNGLPHHFAQAGA